MLIASLKNPFPFNPSLYSGVLRVCLSPVRKRRLLMVCKADSSRRRYVKISVERVAVAHIVVLWTNQFKGIVVMLLLFLYVCVCVLFLLPRLFIYLYINMYTHSYIHIH